LPAPAKTSLIDRVDDEDEPIGRVPRGEVLELGANFRTVHVFVFHAGRLLLQQLAPTRERHPQRWGSSVAAYLHAGEDYEHAARRRLREELGLEGPLTRLGKTRMEDERSFKFVELYAFDDGPAEIREPDHIMELAYWDRIELDDAIIASPERFTPTFLHVYRYFQRRQPPQET
jgi:isopentenyl-diphosphate delta-isomerase